MNYFSSNSISSVELTSEGDLYIKYDKGGQKTVKNETLISEEKKLIDQLKKEGKTSLSKQELEEHLKKLEQERQKLEKGEEQTPSKKPWGLIIGGGFLAVVGLVGLVVLIKNRKSKRK